MSEVRVRFAPSPTGYLHIGGVRTALYNFLYARKNNGTFILRIEDTDQKRYVSEAESYIHEALQWCGIEVDEGPEVGGEYGPYRQSERSDIYRKYAEKLVEKGHAYYAFDTEEELEEMRQKRMEQGVHSPKYDFSTRMMMKNSLSLSEEEVEEKLNAGEQYTIRMKIPESEYVSFEDAVRGFVEFSTDELDDKVILKADGLPTYHLANIVDDYLMEISDVIRGEEWLSSTAHHVLLYRMLEWEDSQPRFAHLPLILKPSGKGKLSKRDGSKLNIPVYPLGWKDDKNGEAFLGFDKAGFNPKAVVNFLAFLGWNPGTEKEIFSMEELKNEFSLDHVSKGGARFDYDKALWYNQQYILNEDKKDLAPKVMDILKSHMHNVERPFAEAYTELYRERVHTYEDFWNQGYYFFEEIDEYDEKNVKKRWEKEENRMNYQAILEIAKEIEKWDSEILADKIKGYIKEENAGFGNILPLLRIALAGTMEGPDVFKMMGLMGKETCIERMQKSKKIFSSIIEINNA